MDGTQAGDARLGGRSTRTTRGGAAETTLTSRARDVGSRRGTLSEAALGGG